MPTRNGAVTSITFAIVGLFLSAWSAGAHASVNPRNGNFYITYSDATLSSKDHELDMTRTYNSKSVKIGWFGFGWGSPFETRLTVMPDQTAVIAESGSGANSFFYDESSERDAQQVAAGVAKIIAAATSQDKLNADAADALSRKLMGNEEERFAAVTKYGLHSELSGNLKLTAYGSGYCAGTLQRTDSGYRRDDGCGKVDDFDQRGNLIRHAEGDKYQITFRVENDHPVEIRDSDGQSINLDWTQDGQVNRLSASNGVVVEYEYDDSRNLTLSNNLAGPTDYLFYRYDYDRNHNMTRIRYVDDSSMFMTYTVKGDTSSVTTRTGERTLYAYTAAPDNSNQYSTLIRNFAKDGSEASNIVNYQESISTTGERKLDSYSIANKYRAATIVLDEKGQIKRKKLSSGEFIAYTYYPTSGKLATVNVNDKESANFDYNAAGELAHVKTDYGQSIDIEYNAQNQISRIVSTHNVLAEFYADLSFKYNKKGQVIEIKQPQALIQQFDGETLEQPLKKGTVTVQYDSKGGIRKVDSDGGVGLALHISFVFQNLLGIIKLAEM